MLSNLSKRYPWAGGFTVFCIVLLYIPISGFFTELFSEEVALGLRLSIGIGVLNTIALAPFVIAVAIGKKQGIAIGLTLFLLLGNILYIVFVEDPSLIQFENVNISETFSLADDGVNTEAPALDTDDAADLAADLVTEIENTSEAPQVGNVTDEPSEGNLDGTEGLVIVSGAQDTEASSSSESTETGGGSVNMPLIAGVSVAVVFVITIILVVVIIFVPPIRKIVLPFRDRKGDGKKDGADARKAVNSGNN